MIDFQQYIKELQSVPIDELTEHSKRSALESLLNQAATENQKNNNKIIVLQEPKRKDDYGAPDFKIYTNNSIIGYVENKKITENLDKILKSEQIKKYKELSQNILLTNYVEFVWIKGEIIEREILCFQSDIDNKKFKLDKIKSDNVKELLLKFFSQTPKGISTPKELALALAVRSKNLKEYIADELNRQNTENEKGVLYDLYDIFKQHIFNELTVSEFSDAFAQMLVYGLFLAKLNADTKDVTLNNVKDFIPTTFQLIHELVKYLDELKNEEYKETKWIIDETLSIMNNLELFELKSNLTFSKKIKDSENIETDAYIYFYETFLSAYDSKLRKSKGVYYTPPQIVNFIVRAINNILTEIFKLTDGLADRNSVTVLDFATGTGTFLIEVIKQIFETVPFESNTKRDLLIREHILKNIFGFEYLIAPYTIAHLKLSQFLKENGYEFQKNERLQIFLTNTLEPIDKQVKIPLLPALTQESKNAQEVKDKPILVITGNPPYSGVSKNNGTWISNLIDDYKYIDGVYFNERKHWLNDDYVKFIRFAQDKMDKMEQGIIGIITNHSFLDNPTFRGMRKSLMNSFNQLYFIDLHGNAKKKEKTPEGEKDENVFDIEQGVCISLMIKKKGLENKIFYTDFWGKRTQKYDLCLQNTMETIDFKEIKPNAPFYFFKDRDENFREQYENAWGMNKIFNLNVSGIVTARDKLVIDFDKQELKKRILDFVNQELWDKDLVIKYNLKETRGWKISDARKILQKEKDELEKYYTKILYRPFDTRFIFYHKNMVDWGRHNLMFNMQNENIALIVPKQNKNDWGVFVTKQIAAHKTVSAYDINYIFPLYSFEKQRLFEKNEPLEKILTKKEKDFNKNKNAFQIALTEFEKHKTVFENIQKPDNRQIEIFEEHRLGFEETQTIFEHLTKNYETEKIQLNKIQEQTKSENIEILENGYIKQPNFTTEFSKYLIVNYQNHYKPEQIFGYIYAILYSETYRTKYAEFLKSDFPKIPFTEDISTFEKLSNLGLDLIDKHLLKTEKLNQKFAKIGIFKGKGNNIVEKVKYTENQIYINENQYFDDVPEKVFNFHIGGYRVLEKYLKDRKDRSIYNDFEHIENLIRILADTIETMQEIDILTNQWI